MKAIYEKKEHFNLIAKHVKSFSGFAPMFHSHCEFIHVVNGSIKVTLDGTTYLLQSGESCLVFPYMVHQYEDAPQTEAYIFLFDADELGNFENTLYTYTSSFPITTALGGLLSILDRITVLYNQNTPLATETALSYLSAIVGELLLVLDLQKNEEKSTDMIKQILTYCNAHFANEDISIQKVADSLFISTSYVSKIFNQKLHYNFREYINILRIRHATELLSDKRYKIVDVMLECGFKNQSSFNRVFYDVVGMSPKEYRCTILEKNL